MVSLDIQDTLHWADVFSVLLVLWFPDVNNLPPITPRLLYPGSAVAEPVPLLSRVLLVWALWALRAGWVGPEPTRAANLVTWAGGRCTGHRLAQCDRVVRWVSFIQWLSFSIPVWFLDYIPNILVLNCAQTSRVVGWFSWRAVLVPAARTAGGVVLVHPSVSSQSMTSRPASKSPTGCDSWVQVQVSNMWENSWATLASGCLVPK